MSNPASALDNKTIQGQGHIMLHHHPIDKYVDMLVSCCDAGSINAISSKALSDPKLYSGFAEILELPTVKQFAAKPLLNTLHLFAYGTVGEYYKYATNTNTTTTTTGTTRTQVNPNDNANANASQGNCFYVHLTDAQLNKLKALTILSTINHHTTDRTFNTNTSSDLSDVTATNNNSNNNNNNSDSKSQSRRNRRRQIKPHEQTSFAKRNSNNIVTYATLQAHLGIDNSVANSTEEIRKLEDLLIHCIYSNLLPSGTKLDQKHKAIHVKLASNSFTLDASHVLSRDVHLTHDLPNMIHTLETFYQKSKETKAKLFTSLSQVKDSCRDDVEAWKQIDLNIQLTQSMLGNGSKGNGNGNIKDGGNTMEDNAKVGSMEWAISASTDRQVKRSRAATVNTSTATATGSGSGSGTTGRKTGIFGFTKRG